MLILEGFYTGVLVAVPAWSAYVQGKGIAVTLSLGSFVILLLQRQRFSCFLEALLAEVFGAFPLQKWRKPLQTVTISIDPADSAAGLSRVVICLSLDLKRKEIRGILKHTELTRFQVEVQCESFYVIRLGKCSFGKKM